MPVEYCRLSAALGPSARGIYAQHRWLSTGSVCRQSKANVSSKILGPHGNKTDGSDLRGADLQHFLVQTPTSIGDLRYFCLVFAAVAPLKHRLMSVGCPLPS